MSAEDGEQGQSSSQRSRHSFEDDSTYAPSRQSMEFGGHTTLEPPGRTRDGGSYRRHRPRNSGGFLLESAFAPSQSSDDRQDISENGPGNQKTNQKNGGRGAKNGPSHRHRTQKSTSLGSSPLASTVINSTPSTADTRQIASPNNSTRLRDAKSYAAHSYLGADGTNDGECFSAAEQLGDQSHTHQPHQLSSSNASTLVDPDPLQIVNLALNLSESRRRGADTARRATSSGLPVTGDQSNDSFTIVRPGGNLKNHLQQSRRASKNLSPDPNRHQYHSVAATHPSTQQPGLLPPVEFTQDHPTQPRISDATLARVEKAKAAIELAVQYRKLLQYIPPIKPRNENTKLSNPSSPLSQTFSQSMSRVVSTASTNESPGRRYNPLQSIRNRKVRARERRPINAEAQGWSDPRRVSSWIEAVGEKSKDPSFLAGEVVDFPAFSPDHRNGDVKLSSPSQTQSGNHYRRPSRDWMTTPAELLADAYWLEQGSNKKQIEDRDGNRIYTGDGPSPSQNPRRSYEKHHRNNGSISGKLSDFDGFDELPQSTINSEVQGDSSLRGRRRQKIQETFRHYRSGSDHSKADHQNGHSPSGSSSSEADHASFKGRKKRKQARRANREVLDSRVLEKQMMEMLKREAKAMEWGSPGPRSVDGSDFNGDSSKNQSRTRPSNDPSDNSSNRSNRKVTPEDESRRRNVPDGDEAEAIPKNQKAKENADDIQNTRISMEGLDITAPSSPHGLRSGPIADHVVPSIALNLSAPASRNSSPTRQPLSKVATDLAAPNSIERREGGNIDETDFAADDRAQVRRPMSRQNTAPFNLNSEVFTSKSPIKKITSRTTDDGSIKSLKRTDSRRQRGEKDERDPDSSKIRGIFKGGRIEEIVRSEVSKVGDFIWKKEPSSFRSRQASPGSSYNSDSDDVANDPRSGGNSTEISRTTTRSRTDELDGSTSQSRYFMGSLPSFKSPFGRPGSSKVSLEPDHVLSKQSSRDQQRSSRFERLPPPKVDSRNATPSSGHHRTDPSRRSAAPRIEERRSSYAQSDRSRSRPEEASTDSREQSRITSVQRSDTLGEPGEFGSRAGQNRLPVTALTALDASGHRSRSKASKESPHRHWSISDRGVALSRGPMTRKEIARVRALLLSSGVKANEIHRKSREVRADPSIKLSNHLTTPLLPLVPRFQRHQYTAQILVHDIELSTKLFEDSAKHFRSVVVSDLFDKIAEVQEEFTLKLTPLVRASADEADAFSTELTTTHTLAIKQLNDSVYTMLRRRRRRLRWVRRGGYVLLEWMLLGVMWFAWFVVVIIRLIRGTVRGIIGAIRWLFWF